MNGTVGIVLLSLMFVTLATLITIYVFRLINHNKLHKNDNDENEKLYNRLYKRQMRQHDRLNKMSIDVLDFAKHQVEQKKKLDAVNSMVVENESTINELEDDMSQNQSAFGTLKTQVSGMETIVKSNTDKHLENKQRISEVNDLASTTNELAMDNQETIQGFDINSLNRKMTMLEGQLGLINENINTNADNIAQLQLVTDED